MKYFSIILIIASLTWTDARCQPVKGCGTVYGGVDINPQYKGGSQDLFDFVWKDLMFTLSNCDDIMEEPPTRLFIDLTIDKNGNVVEVEFRKSTLIKSCEDRLKERLMKMRGWIPGKINGKAVCCKFYLPIGCMKWEQ